MKCDCRKKLGLITILLLIAVIFLGYDEYRIRNNEADLISGEVWKSDAQIIAEDPNMVRVELIAVSDDECEECQAEEVVGFMRAQIFPNLKAEVVQYDSTEGAALVEKLNIAALPAFILDDSVEKHGQWTELQPILKKVGDQYLVNNAAMRLPVAKYLISPTVDENDHVLGSDDAAITIVEYTDFECPFCGRHAVNTVPDIIEKYVDSGDVRYIMKSAPLPPTMHPHAMAAHEAAECVAEQDNDLFWEMHDELFEDQEVWMVANNEEVLREMAIEVGADGDKYDECLSSGRAKTKVAADQTEFATFGAGGVPATFIGNELVGGAAPYEKFEEVIERQLAK